MLLGSHNQNHANIAASKGATDFSIAAIMARGSSSREPSERSLSESVFFVCLYIDFFAVWLWKDGLYCFFCVCVCVELGIVY